MSLRATRASLLVLLSALIAGCCCSVAPRGDARTRNDAAEAPQVFIDMTTARIPEDRAAAVLGALCPNSDAEPRTLTASEARLMIKTWEDDAKVRVRNGPKLLALDGQEATVFIGETLEFLDRKAATNERGGLEFSIEDQQGSPVFVGFRLRATPTAGADGTSITIDLKTTSRKLKQEFTEEERSRMGVQAFLRDGVYESRLSSRFTVRNGGHVLLGSPKTQGDAEGRYIQVTLLHARILSSAEAVGSTIAND